MKLTRELFYEETRIRLVDDTEDKEITELFKWINKKVSQVESQVGNAEPNPQLQAFLDKILYLWKT